MAEVNLAETLKKFGVVKQAKAYTKITNEADKKVACVLKKSVVLPVMKPEFGTEVKTFTDDEIKKRHLGKFKYAIKVKNDAEILALLEKYFAK